MAGASGSYLKLLNKPQKPICRTVGSSLAASLEPLPHSWNVVSLSLLYRYYFGRCSYRINSKSKSLNLIEMLLRKLTKKIRIPNCDNSFKVLTWKSRLIILTNSQLHSPCQLQYKESLKIHIWTFTKIRFSVALTRQNAFKIHFLIIVGDDKYLKVFYEILK